MSGRQQFGRLMLLAAVAVLSAGQVVASTHTLYRYRNAEDVVVIDFSIPPEFAVNGYEVISHDGRVLEIVQPLRDLPSATERARSREQQRLDQFILRSYSTLEDVQQARDRRLTLLDREIEVLKSNIRELRRRHLELRDQAASYQASGAAPPESTEAVMVELREQERSTSALLKEREAQHQKLAEQYAYYGSRLLELKGQNAPEASREAWSLMEEGAEDEFRAPVRTLRDRAAD